MNDAIDMLYQACVRGQCFPGVQPHAPDGKVSTHQILDGLGLIENIEAPVEPQKQSKTPSNAKGDHLLIFTPANAASVSILHNTPPKTVLPAPQNNHYASRKHPDLPREGSQGPARQSLQRPEGIINPKPHSTGAIVQVAKKRGRPPGLKAANRPQTDPLPAPSQKMCPPTITPPVASLSTESASTRMANTLRAISTLPADTARAIKDIHPIFQQSISSFYNPHSAYHEMPSLCMDSQEAILTTSNSNGFHPVTQMRTPQPLVSPMMPDLFGSGGDLDDLWDEEMFEDIPVR